MYDHECHPATQRCVPDAGSRPPNGGAHHHPAQGAAAASGFRGMQKTHSKPAGSSRLPAGTTRGDRGNGLVSRLEALIFLDTHVVVWLYLDPANLLPVSVQEKIQEEPVAISPAVALELEFLREIKRLAVRPENLIRHLQKEIGMELVDEGFARIIQSAKSLRWTRDPFDRLIVGQAVASGWGLITKDRQIRRHFDGAFWGP